MIRPFLLICLSLGSLTACNGSSEPATDSGTLPATGWFSEEADQRGVSFTYHSGSTGDYHMPEIMGGGVALLDVDNDGDLDLLLIGGESEGDQSQHSILANNGSGMFTPRPFPHPTAYGMGVATGDHDHDGDVDLLITTTGADVLLSNDGMGTFTDVSKDAGLTGSGWSTSATFFDADRDGDLDLYICRYLQWSPELALECFNTMGGRDFCSPRNFMAATSDRLLFYDAATSSYIDVSEESGIASKLGTGLGVIAIDADSDGWMDLFVANDGMPDRLWINNRDGTFTDHATAWGCDVDIDGRASAGMGVAAADIDGDGDEEVLVGNLRNESDGLFRNDNGQHFFNTTSSTGLAAANRRFTRFGLGWHDYDHDGHLDLIQANGRVMRQGSSWNDDPYAEPDLLLAGGDRGFSLLGTPVDPASSTTSRGLASGDIDGDGDIDAVIVNRDATASLLINTAANGHWVTFHVADEEGHDAMGSMVTATVDDRTAVRRVRRDGSYLSASSPLIHFGLGEADAIEHVTVTWPDGKMTTHGPFDVNRHHEIRRSPGE